jgi:1-acyl-sn-glycerol-3-phosphate acyltransferase
VVHLFFPWQTRFLRLAREMGIPVCGAFHVQPENVTYNMMIKLLEVANVFIYFLFRNWLYKRLDNIHCPSSFIAGELRRHRYYARLHTFSNGVSDFFRPPATPPEKTGDTITVLMIGRLAEEKRQDLIIKAVKYSKYRDRIQLHFAGLGPMLKRYRRMSGALPNPPRFEFLPPAALLRLIYQTDVYIHASDAEIEGIACIESIACGKVPIISDSKKSAAAQFALDERSLFKKGKYLDLRDKLDYWIEHPEERERMGREYAQMGELYNISHSIKKMEKMFQDVIRDCKTQRLIQQDRKIQTYNRRIERNNFIKELLCRVFYFGICIPLLILINRCFFGMKTENRKVLGKIKKSGAVCICNHIHEMDSTMCAAGVPLRKFIFVSIPANFSLGLAGFFVDALGSIPTPSSPKELQAFIYTLSKHLRRRRLALFFPEGERRNYCEDLREFQRGAFYVAVDAQVPVLPIKITLREPDGLLKLFRKKPCFTLVFGEPLYPNYLLLKNDGVEDLKKRAEDAMRSLGSRG